MDENGSNYRGSDFIISTFFIWNPLQTISGNWIDFKVELDYNTKNIDK